MRRAGTPGGQHTLLGGGGRCSCAAQCNRAHCLLPASVLLAQEGTLAWPCLHLPPGAGEVWANQAECAAIARFLGMSEQHFVARYTKQYSRKPGWRMLRVQPGSGDCAFLKGGTQCGIYPVRPLQCSTYPWWPELMDPGGC